MRMFIRSGTPRGPCPRFNFLTIGAWAFCQAMWATNLYYHLTYWTLMVHVMYFSIDKSSPNSRLAAQVMQGMSFCGAFSVQQAALSAGQRVRVNCVDHRGKVAPIAVLQRRGEASLDDRD